MEDREQRADDATEGFARLGRTAMALVGDSVVAKSAAVDALQKGVAGGRGKVLAELRRACAERTIRTGTARMRAEPRDAERDAQRVRARLAALRPSERDALVLTMVADATPSQLAAALGVDANEARNRVGRALLEMSRPGGGTWSCARITEDPLALLEGTAQEELVSHAATCDACRDGLHTLEATARDLASAGDDFETDEAFFSRAAAASEVARVTVPPAPLEAIAPPTEKSTTPQTKVSAPVIHRGRSRARYAILGSLAFVGIGAGIGGGLWLAHRHMSPEAKASRPWHGKVAQVIHSGADTGKGNGASAKEGWELKEGSHFSTDPRTRARLEMDDGSTLVLDRGTDVEIGSTPRTLRVHSGAVLADVAHVDGAPSAKITTDSGGDVTIVGTRLLVTAADDRTNVEVLRGEVRVAGSGGPVTVNAGEEAVVAKSGNVDVAPANDLAERAAFGESLGHNEDTDAPVSGLGELRARKPGNTDEKDHAVRLSRHDVKIRVAGSVARTEIDETFANDTGDVLEGVYRFPLPPGAQIERLALEVDGKMIDGAFVDKARGAAIFRGAIQNATPNAPKPREDIFWVPGPWRDPALLEWQRGGRFELNFPIPARGTRRVVIAYTETVAPVAGTRRYVYPLPQSTASALSIGNFNVDAQVIGEDPATPVRVRGYELEHDAPPEGGAQRFHAALTSFTPSGDLSIEYALADKATDATAWAFTDTRAQAPLPPATPPTSGAQPLPPQGPESFVSIALRPKLPKWQTDRARDQVIVVDAGRSMVGERLARAKRLAVQLVQEMDRRDRVTVLACDTQCKSLPGGLAGPGSTTAHDVDAFLAGITADGASDLAESVRSAAAVRGHDAARDLRVVLVSDGVATAGYRTPEKLAAEVGDAITDPRAELVAVPIGSDADTVALGEIARGGGGVVVPYEPGESLETAAIDVLGATYGTTLRDVELVMPDGAIDVAPARLPALRAGSETIVSARLRGDRLAGDVILRGKVGGDPFEAKYPVNVQTTTDASNAFVPRLYAAARIADEERVTGDSARAEVVGLSQRYAVPSRFTSLLVLESEAMFRAFGIDHIASGAEFTGETAAVGTTVATLSRGDGHGKDEEQDKADDSSGSLGAGFGLGGIGGGGRASAQPSGAADDDGNADLSSAIAGAHASGPAKKRPPLAVRPSSPSSFDGPSPPPAPPQQQAQTAPMPDATAAPREEARKAASATTPVARDRWNDAFEARAVPSGGRWMKRIWVRRGSIAQTAAPSVNADKLAQARAAMQAAPDDRTKHLELARLLAASGDIDELDRTLSAWAERDPLDVDLATLRADALERRGDRDAGVRVLGGALAGTSLGEKDAALLAGQVARAMERDGDAGACAFRVTAAESTPGDLEAVARAVKCERDRGRSRDADAWVALQKTPQPLQAQLAKLDGAQKESPATGDVVVEATWSGGTDLDIGIIDPKGARLAWAGRAKGVRVDGARSLDHETLGISSSQSGSFGIELTRADGGEAGDARPVNGRIVVRAFGNQSVIPFVLTGARSQIARVDSHWEEQIIDADPPVESLPPFNRSAAARNLAQAPVNACFAPDGPTGNSRATIRFGTNGRVQNVSLQAPYSGTGVGACIVRTYSRISVPAFDGSATSVAIGFDIE